MLMSLIAEHCRNVGGLSDLWWMEVVAEQLSCQEHPQLQLELDKVYLKQATYSLLNMH